MKESVFKSYEELPLFLNAEVVGKVLGVSISTAYELMCIVLVFLLPIRCFW